MSTIEGGMVCTNNKKIYQIARSLRSHGMLRELTQKLRKKNNKKNPKLLQNLYFCTKVLTSETTKLVDLGLNKLKDLIKY